MMHQAREGAFFFYYAVILLLVVLLGFAPSFFARVIVDPTPLPLHLHVHGALLTGWFVLLAVQAGLVQRDRLAMHRWLGPFAAAYGILIVFGGLLATFNMVPRILALGPTLETDMGQINPLQASGISFGEFAAGIVWFNILSVLSFAALLILGVVYRRRTDFHKRFVLLASVAIIPPAVARMARLAVGTEQGLFIPLGLLGLLGLLVAHDVHVYRRVHPASVVGIAILFVCNAVAGLTALSATGLAFVRWLA